MVTQEKLYTVAEYLEIANLPENENKRLELINGVIIEMPPSSKKNTIIAARIVHFLSTYVIEKSLGFVSGADGGYKIDENTTLMPDAAFISSANVGDLDGVIFDAAPDLAVEVISPSESAGMVMQKTRKYLDAGTKALWSVYPELRDVHIHTRSAEGGILTNIYGEDDTLSGGDALPGFAVAVKVVFP